MVGRVYHIGITVSNLEKSIKFYRDILGLKLQGIVYMNGEETDRLFNKKDCKVKLAYLNGSKSLETPPIELIYFINDDIKKVKQDLFTTSISEICFYTDDIIKIYEKLIKNNVECLSEPEFFDFTEEGFGKSKAFYFKDPDGIILEMMQPIE